MKTIKLELSVAERQKLKQKSIKISSLPEYAADEIAALLNVSGQRGIEISAHIAFQNIPSIGPKFAADLISMGYYSIDMLLDKNGAALLNEYEQKQGFWTDPCVEDQFWLAVHYANNPGSTKQWWDFTADRKAYRAKYGYPANRPPTAWHKQIPA